MGRYWNVRVLERRFSLINSSHRYATQPNYRSTPNYPTKTKARVPLSLFVALRLFSRADSRSGVHITCFSQKNKMYWISFFLNFFDTLDFVLGLGPKGIGVSSYIESSYQMFKCSVNTTNTHLRFMMGSRLRG